MGSSRRDLGKLGTVSISYRSAERLSLSLCVSLLPYVPRCSHVSGAGFPTCHTRQPSLPLGSKWCVCLITSAVPPRQPGVWIYVCVLLSVCVSQFVCQCVCESEWVSERERESERENLYRQFCSSGCISNSNNNIQTCVCYIYYLYLYSFSSVSWLCH